MPRVYNCNSGSKHSFKVNGSEEFSIDSGGPTLGAGTEFDLNGLKLVLDADADTSITADTDDQIDIEIEGADDFKFTANTFTILSGSSVAFSATTDVLDMNGAKIDLDAAATTSIHADTDNQIDIEIGGADDFQFTANTFTALSGSTIKTNTIAETTASNGIACTSRLTTTDGVTGGTARVVGGRAYSNTAASAAITNTTTEALFDAQYSIPADTLKAGSVVKVRYQGIATATNSSDTLTIVLRIGGVAGTALLTGTATDVANSNIFAGECTLVCRTAGASGTFVAVGTHTDVPAASGTAAHDITEITASTTINTTTAQVIGVTADWSVADPGNSVRLDIFVVEIL